METRIQEILAQPGTKTSKMQQLILLGLTRREIADLVANGNYGFVQNVYAKMRAQGLLNLTPQQEEERGFDRRFGVEFEAFGVNRTLLCAKLNEAGINCHIEGYNHNTRNHWKIVNDSSIVGRDGFEVVSPVLNGAQGMAQVETVCRVLKECNAKVNRSCGTHVHIDAQNISLQTWKNIYINYSRFERTIDDFMPNSRKANNNYFTNGFSGIDNFEAKINQASNLQSISGIFSNSRYFKINPVSYARHNTIEFRQHSGTIEFEKISNWIYFLSNLIKFSETSLATDKTLNGLAAFNDESIMTYLTNRTNKLKNI